MDANKIGLEEKTLRPVVDELNDLLANYHIHYQNLRGCHWNVKGKSFFSLHAKFEELYTQILQDIDELAERILSLGKNPVSTFQEYIQLSSLKEIKSKGMKETEMVKSLSGDMMALIEKERELLKATEDAGDDGTNDMVNRFMQFKEKNLWMLRAFINEE